MKRVFILSKGYVDLHMIRAKSLQFIAVAVITLIRVHSSHYRDSPMKAGVIRLLRLTWVSDRSEIFACDIRAVRIDHEKTGSSI